MEFAKENARNITLAVVVILIVGALYYLDDNETGVASRAEITPETLTEIVEEKAKTYPRAREIVSPSGFVNTEGEPVTVEEFIGEKVILVDFWTYSCINCQRTQPFLNAWYEKYEDEGLVILGIHTPEFEFEKDIENVQNAVLDAEVKYPVVLDNDYRTWSAYQNRYWPRKYLIDIDGFIVYDHIGEGAYEETERIIQALLLERSERLGGEVSVQDTVDPEGVEETSRFVRRTPEIYFGAWRNQDHFGNGMFSKEHEVNFELPLELIQDKFHLEGIWNITREFAENKKEGARIVLPYQAQKIFMVAHSEEGATVRVLVDGEPVEDIAGEHVEDGVIEVQNEQLYRIIEGEKNHTGTLELIVEEGELEIFTFTFG